VDEFLTLAEAAARLRVSERWLQGSSAPRHRPGHKTVRYEATELDLWGRGACLVCGKKVGTAALDFGMCAACSRDAGDG